jgi:hypothetical protein
MVVFVASSSEHLGIAETAAALLHDALSPSAEVRAWKGAFELSKTFIEALENATEEADFAVAVVTSDDVNISRETAQPVPRDNVLFELGLFMGALGRERTFILKEQMADLKLPTDLLGVHVATFSPSVSLDVPCREITDRIVELGTRFKLNKNELASLADIRRFCESIEGPLWERIRRDDISALSFFWIRSEAAFNSVSMNGTSYSTQGTYVADWKSLIARIDKNKKKILYHWEGQSTILEIAHVTFHGFGVFEFDSPAAPGEELQPWPRQVLGC